MIEINLLPEDLKRAPKAASGRRTVILAGMLLAAVAGGIAYFHVAYVAPREALGRDLAGRLAGLKKHTEELARVESAVKQVVRRKSALKALYDERLLWSEKLDQLIDIVPPNVWLRGVRLSSAPRSRRDAGRGILTLECYSAGSEEKGVTLFRERLRDHEAFYRDIGGMNPPSIAKREFAGYVEGQALEFTLNLPVKAATPATPAPAAGPARGTRTAQVPN